MEREYLFVYPIYKTISSKTIDDAISYYGNSLPPFDFIILNYEQTYKIYEFKDGQIEIILYADKEKMLSFVSKMVLKREIERRDDIENALKLHFEKCKNDPEYRKLKGT